MTKRLKNSSAARALALKSLQEKQIFNLENTTNSYQDLKSKPYVNNSKQ